MDGRLGFSGMGRAIRAYRSISGRFWGLPAMVLPTELRQRSCQAPMCRTTLCPSPHMGAGNHARLSHNRWTTQIRLVRRTPSPPFFNRKGNFKGLAL